MVYTKIIQRFKGYGITDQIFQCIFIYDEVWISITIHTFKGGGPRVVDSTAAFHVRVRGSVPGLGGLKETKNVSSSSTCESQYCARPQTARTRISNPVSGRQCHLNHPTILRRFSWPSLAYMCTKVA